MMSVTACPSRQALRLGVSGQTSYALERTLPTADGSRKGTGMAPLKSPLGGGHRPPVGEIVVGIRGSWVRGAAYDEPGRKQYRLLGQFVALGRF
jgi:hypothetical protein